ncbi:unnamed protein product, partial [Heterosigma akashiwo]
MAEDKPTKDSIPSMPTAFAVSAQPTGEYDLTATIAPYLDNHMMFPLLDFIEDNKMYDTASVQKARLDLLAPTNMVDYAMEIHANLHKGEKGYKVPEEMTKRRQEVLDQMAELKQSAARSIEILDDAELVEKLKSEDKFNTKVLEEEYQVGPAALEAYYAHAKFQFECGDYGAARGQLGAYLALTQAPASDRGFAALWGKFASEVLVENWEGALAELGAVKAAIEARADPALAQLAQRSWLLHWALFVAFAHPRGRDLVADLFFEERYLQALQTNCPWLLRYLTAAVVVNRRGQRGAAVLRDLVWAVRRETAGGGGRRQGAGPPPRRVDATAQRFLECLYVNFDFDKAQVALRECEKVLVGDFFLCSVAQEFLETARLLVFETYCRIHQTIDLGSLAQELSMAPADAEKWLVDLIRGALLDAKISGEDGVVQMGGVGRSAYQKVIDKTKDLMTRGYVLANNLEKLVVDEGLGLPAGNGAGAGAGGKGGGEGARGGRGHGKKEG